jgi:tetratricopeptide (TPR) repeat protein
MDDSSEKLEELRAAYESHREDPGAGANLAQYYADLGWDNEAFEVYRDLAARFPQDYALLLDYGNILQKRAMGKEALAVFRTLTTLKPDRLEGWNNLGIVQLTMGGYDEARTSFEKVLELEPDNCGALLNMGNYHDRKGDNITAVTFFQRATGVRKDFPEAWFNLGNAYVKAAEYEKAVAAYQRAIRVEREFPSAQKNLGYAYERMNDFLKAEEHYTAALELNKADSGLYVNLANVYVKQEKFDRAKSFYLRAVKLAPKDPAGWMGLRKLSLMKGDISLFVQSTLALMKRLDSDAVAESVRKMREMKNFKNADQIIKTADRIGITGDELDAERLLAFYRNGQNAGKEKALYRRLSQVREPGDTILYCLAEYAYDTGDTVKSFEYISAIRQPLLVHDLLRWRLLILRGDLERAENEIRAYLQHYDDCFECWHLLARVCAARNKPQEVKACLFKALETGFVDHSQIVQDPAMERAYREITDGASEKV